MPGSDPNHWLHRLSAEEWLRAAANELERATEALSGKHHRMGVAGARRAAGMAWNAVLTKTNSPDDLNQYGRSYMEHLKALGSDPSAPAEVKAAALALVSAPLELQLIPLGKGDATLAGHAECILRHAQGLISPPVSA